MNARVEIVPSLVERIKQTMVGLKMPRAIEILDATVRRLFLLSQKAAGHSLGESNSGDDSRPAWGLRWAWLMTMDRGLRCMSRVLRA